MSLVPLTHLQSPSVELEAFANLPMSEATKKGESSIVSVACLGHIADCGRSLGLKQARFSQMTDIQAKSLPLALKGRDVLGAARTGSGKTLAFLIPMLEILHRQKWGQSDGLGALIISPTRELVSGPYTFCVVSSLTYCVSGSSDI